MKPNVPPSNKMSDKKLDKNQGPSSIDDSARCQHRTTKGRCTMLAIDPKRQLCFDHARQTLKLHQEADFAKYLTKEASGFQTASGINCALGDLYVLLAQGHITPRRAAVLAHICSLLLRTFPAIENDPSPDADRDLTPYTEAESAGANSPDNHPPGNDSVGSAGILPARPAQATQEESPEQNQDEAEGANANDQNGETNSDIDDDHVTELHLDLGEESEGEEAEENDEDPVKTSKPN
jgi:hypothetical protein